VQQAVVALKVAIASVLSRVFAPDSVTICTACRQFGQAGERRIQSSRHAGAPIRATARSSLFNC
jgi:hypothetical protein